MASFCKECSIDLFGKDYGDFAMDDLPENMMTFVLCEGCGWIWVDKEGKRITDNDDKKRTI